MTKTTINGIEFNTDTIIEIGKFTILWNIFENNKCNCNCDTDKLIQLVSDISSNEYWQNLARILQKRKGLRGYNVDEYVDYGLSLGRGLSPIEKEDVKNFMLSDGKECLAGGLLAIYRIRNNMFHGLKDWIELERQKELFAKLNEFLTYAIRNL